ncbi:thrombospondin type-1 domain-containing protein 4-like isoform X2 [Oratosquilla oratoria]|uniref:thrombospondin type-1 domain-containing protein 4-like isoform X2 n=1 Tax=Oratosquilla oratoria TaxID=337810 RepID=UPI003F762FE2
MQLRRKRGSVSNQKIISTKHRLALVGVVWAALVATTAAQGGESTYPEQVHRLVVERLGRLRGSSSGTWGEWSPWTPCSRSCGRGVSIQARECLMAPGRQRTRSRRATDEASADRSRRAAAPDIDDDDDDKSRGKESGNRCVGLYKRFQLCNTQSCGERYTDFRRQQCEAFNNTPFVRRFYTWEPYYDSLESCALNCRAVGLSFYATLNQTVIDGTPCGGHGQEKLCVEGRCMEIGCDGVLGSGKAWDVCGVCGGDNSTCRVISGIYPRARLPYGYNVIATLPPGATNISIEQVKPSTNYLALRRQNGDFFVNGNWAINESGDYSAAGTIFTYKKPDRYQGDKVMAAGPLTEPVDIMLFYQTTNPGIKYEYRLPMSSPSRSRRPLVRPGAPQVPLSSDNPLNPRVPGGPAARTPPSGPVNDAMSSNSHSNAIYGRRWQEKQEEAEKEKKKKRKEKGLERKTNKKDDEMEKRRKEERRKEKRRKRRYEWKAVGFTSCTKTCGGGSHTTRVVCVKRRKGSEVPDRYCAGQDLPARQTVRCNLKPCPAMWMPEAWGPCSVTCGLGVQRRKFSCQQEVSPAVLVSVSEAACTKPPTLPEAQVCDQGPCNKAPSWEAGEWGYCSTQCGMGSRSRTITCVGSSGPLLDHYCSQVPEPKPVSEEPCDMGSCAVNTWFFSEWETKCSEECGHGIQRRSVYCSGDVLDNRVTETSCDPTKRPEDTRVCHEDKGCGGKWFAGPWSECSAECGPGKQTRAVVCVVWSRGQWKVAASVGNCKEDLRPETSRECAQASCAPRWYMSQWSECSASCDGGVQQREVRCMDPDQEPSPDCTQVSRPMTQQPCNTHSCHEAQADQSARNTSGNESSSAEDVAETATVPVEKTQDSLERKGPGACMDRMKNCHLVYKARLCRLKYYNKLCCQTCSQHQ